MRLDDPSVDSDATEPTSHFRSSVRRKLRLETTLRNDGRMPETAVALFFLLDLNGKMMKSMISLGLSRARGYESIKKPRKN